MRGKGWQVGFQHASERITPACAGKSCLAAIYAYNEGDHPRVCGEKSVPLRCSISAVGSPPRVRGKAWRLPAAPGTQGITPACAGKSRSIAESVLAFRDHPRVCGEKRTSGSGSQRSEGSPPRVRGKETQTAIRVIAGGITPACAGKSFSAVRWQPSHGDHPRVCGEKLRCCMRWQIRRGSPPRVRGKAQPSPGCA